MRYLVAPLALAAVAISSPGFAAGPTARPEASARVVRQKPVIQPSASVARSATITAKAPRTPTARATNSRKPDSSPAPSIIPPAIAAPPTTASVDCGGSLSIFGSAATDCAGFFPGNLLNGSPADLAAQADALAELGFTFSGDLEDYWKIETSDASFLDFGQQLFGPTIIGIHFGNGSGVGNSTGFFEFDFASGVNGISLNIPGSSGVVLYQTGTPPAVPAVPEPATWAMMLLGFGGIGFAMRRRRSMLALPQTT